MRSKISKPIEPQYIGTITFIQKDPTFPCAFKGQVGVISKILSTKALYTILKCGHPYIVDETKFELVQVHYFNEEHSVNGSVSNKNNNSNNSSKKEITMALKQSKVVSAKGVIHVQGFEEEVERYVLDDTFSSNLASSLAERKELFRSKALQAARALEDSSTVKRVEFLSKSTALVGVSLPDPEKDGNRVTIKPDLVSNMLKLGVDLADLNVTTETSTYTLSGEFVQWMDQILQENYVSKGLAIPDGIDKKTSTKLTAEGVLKIEALKRQTADGSPEHEAYTLLLTQGLSAPTVKATDKK